MTSMSLRLYVQLSMNPVPKGFAAMQGDAQEVVRQCYGTSLISPHDMVAIMSKLAETGFGNGPADTLGSSFDVCGLPTAVLLFLAIVKNPIMQKFYLEIYKQRTCYEMISAYGYELSSCPLALQVDEYYVARSHGFVSGYDGFLTTPTEPPSGVSAGHKSPHDVLFNLRGGISFPLLSIGVFTLLK